MGQRAETEVGVSIAAAAEGGPIEKMTCAGAETAELHGAMVGKISPVNIASKTQTLTFNASSLTGEPELPGTYSGEALTEGGQFIDLGGFLVFPHVPDRPADDRAPERRGCSDRRLAGCRPWPPTGRPPAATSGPRRDSFTRRGGPPDTGRGARARANMRGEQRCA